MPILYLKIFYFIKLMLLHDSIVTCMRTAVDETVHGCKTSRVQSNQRVSTCCEEPWLHRMKSYIKYTWKKACNRHFHRNLVL